MRMMTGAILILAHSLLYAVYILGDMSENQPWLKWYSFALAGIGGIFMLWGLVKDLSAGSWKRRRHKGDT